MAKLAGAIVLPKPCKETGALNTFRKEIVMPSDRQPTRTSRRAFLGSAVLDVGLPSAEFARDWIAKVGQQPI